MSWEDLQLILIVLGCGAAAVIYIHWTRAVAARPIFTLQQQEYIARLSERLAEENGLVALEHRRLVTELRKQILALETKAKEDHERLAGRVLAVEQILATKLRFTR